MLQLVKVELILTILCATRYLRFILIQHHLFGYILFNLFTVVFILLKLLKHFFE